MKTYHISHTDLDGYGCHLVTRTYLKNVIYYNVNYGDIMNTVKEVLQVITKEDTLLITDLNLKFEDSKYLNEIQLISGFNLLLIDHHITGQDSANEYNWYLLDTTISATKATYNYFKTDDTLDYVINLINIYDMWKENAKDFNKAQVLSNAIFNNKIDSKKNSLFLTSLILQMQKELKETENVLEVEGKIPYFVKDILSDMTDIPELKQEIQSLRVALNTKLGIFGVDGIEEYLFCSGDFVPGNRVTFNNIEGFGASSFKPIVVKYKVYSDISSTTGQYGFNFMFNNFDLDDTVLVKLDRRNGTLSCRSRNDKAVEFAKIFNGGGHTNAAGCKNDVLINITAGEMRALLNGE